MSKKNNITIMLKAGRLPIKILDKVQELMHKYNLEFYFSTAQNLRLLNINEEDKEDVKAELVAAGAEIRKKGRFPIPRICVGRPYCNFGLCDTRAISEKILDHFQGRTVKAKIKIAVSACPANCANAVATDIGIFATKGGLHIYAGGKGGPRPKAGRRIAKNVDEDAIIPIIEKLVDFHTAKTKKKQRMAKLLSDPEFPYPEV
jgi:dissimilatory sulfite reductase (desulfoviridin) alpha/beta subunit